MAAFAIYNFSNDILVFLIVHKVDLAEGNKVGRSPAHVAAQFNNIFALDRLQRAGVDFHKPDNDGVTPVCTAASFGRVEAMVCLVGFGSSVNAQITGCPPPAYYAVLNGNVPVLEYLHGQGVDLGKPILGGGFLAHFAVSKHQTKVIEFLRDAGYDLSVVSDVGGSGRFRGLHAIYIAAESGHLDLLRLLHAAGVSLDSPPEGGLSPAVGAARTGTPGPLSCLRYLIENGADVAKVCPVSGFSPLLSSVTEGRSDSLKLMLSLKPELINYRFKDQPLLVYAASMPVENVSILQVLIDAGVDLTVVSSVSLACQCCHCWFTF